jgi:hypothetical protein
VLQANAAAEDLHAAAGACGFGDWRGKSAHIGEFLGHRLGVGEHGRGADDADLVAGLGVCRPGEDDRDGSGREHEFFHCSLLLKGILVTLFRRHGCNTGRM